MDPLPEGIMQTVTGRCWKKWTVGSAHITTPPTTVLQDRAPLPVRITVPVVMVLRYGAPLPVRRHGSHSVVPGVDKGEGRRDRETRFALEAL